MDELELSNPWDGAPILYLETTRSTMEDALGLARKGYPSGTTVVADYQEAGRGRVQGRRWQAEAGKNLLFTLVLREPEAGAEPLRFPLLVGLAVARALESAFGLAPVIKWPNDVLCGSAGCVPEGVLFASEGGFLAKVAGVLCEAAAQGERLVLLAGVGVNCNQADIPGERSAVSLSRLLGREVDRLALLARILAGIRDTLADRHWKPALLDRLYLLGREVRVRVGMPDGPGARRLEGTLAGLGDDGSLHLRLPNGQHLPVYSGELEKGP